MKKKCKKHEALLDQAKEVLQRIHELSAKQKVVVNEDGVSLRFMSLDSELELAMGEKERAIGSLREHDEEHGCQSDPRMQSLNMLSSNSPPGAHSRK